MRKGLSTVLGAAALGIGMFVAPQALGVATADRGATDSSSSTAQHAGPAGKTAHRNSGSTAANRNRTVASNESPPRPALAPAAGVAPPRVRSASPASVSPADASPSAAAVGAAPDPNAVVATKYGELGKWMLQPNGEIANWIGVPYQNKTLLEGINVVFVDSAATSARQAARNLNIWMRRASFGASPFSSTGYKAILGGTTYSQQPTGAREAYRDASFLLPNSHGRAFGAYVDPDSSYVFTASWSKEKVDTARLTHGHESFQKARTALLTNMVAKGATNLGEIDMGNAVPADDPTYSTGDADGKAIVLGWNVNMGIARPYRGAPALVPLPAG